VVDIVHELADYGADVDVYDPWADSEEVCQEYGVSMVENVAFGAYDAIVVAVAHKEFADAGSAAIRAYGKEKHILYDLKYVFESSSVDLRL
jgi:UDP-N-acetyl-D-galactosamine dehydrogenase